MRDRRDTPAFPLCSQTRNRPRGRFRAGMVQARRQPRKVLTPGDRVARVRDQGSGRGLIPVDTRTFRQAIRFGCVQESLVPYTYVSVWATYLYSLGGPSPNPGRDARHMYQSPDQHPTNTNTNTNTETDTMPGHDEKTGGPAPPVVSPVQQEQPTPEAPRRVQSQGAKSTSERPSLWTRIQESWITELVALVVSAGAIAAIVGLLSKYNESELPEWNGVSLNSLVSWLTTVAGICIGYVAGTSIGQLKWVHMAQKPRKLEDLKLFNGADGIVGPLELLLRLRFK